MREWDEIAEHMVPAYLKWLEADPPLIVRHRTMDNARAFVKLDPFLADESATMRDNIAAALHRLSGRLSQS